MMRGYMAYPCDEELTLEKKLRLFLMMSLKVYNVPEYETEQIVQFVGRLDIRSISEQVMQELFRELAMHFEFSLAGLEPGKKEEKQICEEERNRMKDRTKIRTGKRIMAVLLSFVMVFGIFFGDEAGCRGERGKKYTKLKT